MREALYGSHFMGEDTGLPASHRGRAKMPTQAVWLLAISNSVVRCVLVCRWLSGGLTWSFSSAGLRISKSKLQRCPWHPPMGSTGGRKRGLTEKASEAWGGGLGSGR